MCGICGFVTGDGHGESSRPVIEAMTEPLSRRGPDDAGYYLDRYAALGHRRLSIIDLAQGHQPLSNEDGTVWVVFNGEIYNFRELRAALERGGHRFQTRTDTEVLVHLYEDVGEALVERISGMFALAIWDARRRRLILARDRMGEKPLYYAPLPGGIAFASELKSLRQHPGVDAGLNLRSLSRYLLSEYVPSPFSIIEGVRKLPRARVLSFAGGQVRERVYWRPDPPAPRTAPPSLPAAAAELWDRVKAAAGRQLVSDVPLGVFLSGGIDSSTVAACIRQLRPTQRLKTFTIGFDDPSFDESQHARTVAAWLGTDHQEQVFEVDQVVELLPEVAEFLDEPLADASILPTYLLSRFARRQVTVALGGDGGDELLAGYPTFQAARPAAWFRRLPGPVQRAVAAAVRHLPVNHRNISLDFQIKQFIKGAARPPELAHHVWLGSFTSREQAELLSSAARAELAGFDPEVEVLDLARSIPATDPLGRLCELYAHTYLQDDVLVKVDRASMACGLEVRAPLLDPEVVSFITGLPPAYKQAGWHTKRVLKLAARKHLPPEIVDRKKKGFGIPVARWLLGGLKPMLTDLLAPDRLARQGIFEPRTVARLIEEHDRHRVDHRKPLWTLLMFQLWYDRWSSPPARRPALAPGSSRLVLP